MSAISGALAEYLETEFTEPIQQLGFLEDRFFKKGETQWVGHVVVIKFDPITKEITVGDMFYSSDEARLSWTAFSEYVSTIKQIDPR